MPGFWKNRSVRVQICDYFGEPQTLALALDLLAPSLWNGAAAAPGSRGDVRQLWLDNFTEPEADRLAAGKRPALGPGWKRKAAESNEGGNGQAPGENFVGSWQSFPGVDEQIRIADTIAEYEADYAEIAQNGEEDLSEADTRRLAELDELLSGLRSYGHLKNVPGLQFGNDADAIYRALSAPNFDFRYRSKFTLEWGRPFTLWLHRYQPEEGQINHTLTLEIGRLLRLVFEKDKCTLYRKNAHRNPTEWATKDARRAVLANKRYGTRQQMQDIQDRLDGIEVIKQQYKGRKPTPEEKAQIKAIKEEIATIRKSFALTDAEKQELQEIEKFLFTQTESVDLNETTDSLVGVPFSLTFFDFGFGIAQIVCDIGRNRWIYQDKEILKSQQWGWLWGTDANRRAADYDSGERLEISGNGGALVWQFGYVDVNKTDVLLGAPLNLNRSDIDTENGVTVNGQWTPNLPAGVVVDFILNHLGDSDPARIGWYQIGVRFATDGQHYPIVTRASIQLPAAPRAANSVVWDSAIETHGGIELNAKFDEKRGVIYEVKIHNRDGMELPERLYERVVNIYADDEPLMVNGTIGEETREHLQGIVTHTQSSELEAWGEVTFPCIGKLRIARQKRFPAEFTFDGMRENDIIRTALGSIGYTEAELAAIPAGEGNAAHSAAPGEAPVLKPDKDARVLDYLEREIVEKVGNGKQIYEAPDGTIRYDDPSDRLFAVPYTNGRTATDARRQYFASDKGVISRSWNTDDYFTQYTVEGGTNPETKKPYSKSYEIREAVDDAFGPDGSNDPRYIGHHKPMATVKDDNLNSQAACERVLATQLKLHGYPRPEWRVVIPYSEEVLPGDRMVFEGGVFKLLGIPGPGFTEDEMQIALREVMGDA